MKHAAAALALWLVLAPAAAACPKTSLGDVEDEVMCPACGTSLAIASENQPLAQRERALIQRLIDRCESKDEVKAALKSEFGDEVLATPDDSGFGLAAYLIPLAILVAAGTAITVGARRWRGRGTAAAGSGHEPPGRESRRLDEDLARYDL